MTQPIKRSIAFMHGEAYIGDTLACESDMVAQVIKNKE
jgi:UDP-3-O-[3-hydroxymyristoyl] N-acetylglucosamine deacetylase/3-hydroxyacyl-[acyl-carrier-protein] dehydratase